MRIISGTHKGRRLMAPSTLPVRPTTDRAKESLFNIIQNRYYFEEKNMLDLYSGTGNIAYEFASRGCDKILAVDNNYNCINYIEKTANNLGFNIATIKSDCLKYLKNCKQEFDFIFADPPYQNKNLIDIPDLVFNNEWLAPNGLLIMEHGPYTSFSDHKNFVELRKYGNVNFSFFE